MVRRGALTIDELVDTAMGREGGLLIQRLQKVWGTNPSIRMQQVNIIADELYQTPHPRWVMSLSRS